MVAKMNAFNIFMTGAKLMFLREFTKDCFDKWKNFVSFALLKSIICDEKEAL